MSPGFGKPEGLAPNTCSTKEKRKVASLKWSSTCWVERLKSTKGMNSKTHDPRPSGLLPIFAARLSILARSGRAALLAAAGLFASIAGAQTVYILDGANLRTAPLASPAAISAPLPITGVTAGETLVSIDVRPQNQQLYALGVNAAANTATLYCLSPKTGFAGVVGSGSFSFTTDGVIPVDFPDPATVGWDIDFNPAADRLRVVAGSLNFRLDPNTGLGVDGNNGGAVGTGTNPDGPINGGTTTVSATAYTNNQPNNGNVTTQYTLDSSSNSIFIQNPPNSGTQTLGLTVTLGGGPLDFSTIVGFDIPAGVNAPATNAAVTTGSGFALMNVGGVTGLYSLNLVNGQATFLGTVANGKSLAIRQELGAAVAMNSTGTALVRFSTTTPLTVTTQTLNLAPLVAGEALVGIDFRPQTGQFYGLAIDHSANTGSLYLLDPQNGTVALAVPGTASAITFAGVDFPDPAVAGYGIDFNPTVDRLRVVTSNGRNFRVNPNTGLPAAATVDGNINGSGVTGVSATAYTNSYGQSLTGGVTTQYTLDAVSNSLYIQNPPNNGTQTLPLPVTVGGSPLDFDDLNGFDIPSAVAVTVSNTVAVGDGWFVATVGGVTKLYRLNLATGAATSVDNVGAGTTPLSGLTVFTTPVLRVQDSTSAVIFDGLKTIDFGNVPQGSVATSTVTVTNTGTQTLIYSATIPAGGYAVTQNASGTLAPGGGTATIEISYNGAATGVENKTLTIATNDTANAAFDIALTGNSFLGLTDDAATVTTGNTTLFPMANDGLGSDFEITSVSDLAIAISPNGRSLIIPPGFSGSFNYTVSDGTLAGIGTINVTAGTPVVNPINYSGLLTALDGEIVGSATATISAHGLATVKLAGGTVKAATKISVPTVGSSGANFTPLGYVTLERRINGTLQVSLTALGGDIGGTLLPVQKTAPVAKHHIALASINATLPGGSYAIATTSVKGVVKITGLLPDGVPFSAASALRDNQTIAFYTAVKGPKPPAMVGGELTLANLTKTDITGQVSWLKQPQLPGVKGLHLDFVDTVMNANGSLYDGTTLLPPGNGTLNLSGGDLNGNESNAVMISTAGIPTVPTGALKTWTGAKLKLGKFAATVMVPAFTKAVKGSGLYLPKSKRAWGFFPGKTVGGRIELTVP